MMAKDGYSKFLWTAVIAESSQSSKEVLINEENTSVLERSFSPYVGQEKFPQ